MRSTREQFIETACSLMESQGFHATGLNQIIEQSGAPKGSLYYHFREGKVQLAEEAISWAGENVAERIRLGLSGSDEVAEAVRAFVVTIAHFVEASGYRGGGPLTAVAMETATSNERLNRACRNAYTKLQGAFEARLRASGAPQQQAVALATFIIAAIEGGVILSRTYHTGEPLRLIAAQLGQMLEGAGLSQAATDLATPPAA